MFPPGHWIALTDGSGIMNTSTPKSCRQKMYNTPCPPESPVSSAISQPNFDNVCDVAGTEGEQIPYYGVQDKAGPVIPDNETSTTRRGPKINGVRRTLVSNGPPMARNKGTPTLTEETREAKTPRQDKATPKSKNQSSLGNTPRDHPSANQKQGIKKKMNREDSVKPKTVGNTFVVGHGKCGVSLVL
ncbi:hypothetical protein QZH41_009141 [Actinostola sp. cb2023]|nr:hypothetical protein QZH41_009141 [Actinostola sp. cb2023]